MNKVIDKFTSNLTTIFLVLMNFYVLYYLMLKPESLFRMIWAIATAIFCLINFLTPSSMTYRDKSNFTISSAIIYFCVCVTIFSYVPAGAIGPNEEVLVCVEQGAIQEYWQGDFWRFAFLEEGVMICAKRQYEIVSFAKPHEGATQKAKLVLDVTDKKKLFGKLRRFYALNHRSLVSFMTKSAEDQVDKCLILVWSMYESSVTHVQFGKEFLDELPEDIRAVCDMSPYNLQWQKVKMHR